jgi:hypothetical protein
VESFFFNYLLALTAGLQGFLVFFYYLQYDNDYILRIQRRVYKFKKAGKAVPSTHREERQSEKERKVAILTILADRGGGGANSNDK